MAASKRRRGRKGRRMVQGRWRSQWMGPQAACGARQATATRKFGALRASSLDRQPAAKHIYEQATGNYLIVCLTNY